MKRFFSIIMIALFLAGIFPCASAMAGDFSLSVSPNPINASAGQTVTLTATVKNNGSGELSGFSIVCEGTECYSSGATVAPGGTVTANFNFTVTASMISAGSVSFRLESGGGTIATDTVMFQQAQPKLVVTESYPDPKTTALLNVNDVIQITFTLQNQGDIKIDNISVKASGVNGGKPFSPSGFSLSPGAKKTVYSSFTFKSKITIKPVVTFSVNGSTQTMDLAPITMDKAIADVEAKLSVNNAKPQAGEEVIFTLNITNNGNITYTKVSASWNGENWPLPTSTLSPGQTITKTYKRAFEISEDVQLTITLTKQQGPVSIHTNTVKILLPIDQQDLKQNISFVIKADRTKMTSGGTVNFTGYVANNSYYDLSGVSVSDPLVGEVLSVAKIPAGSRETISAQATVEKTATFNFVLTASDREGQQYTFEAEPITVTVIDDSFGTPEPSVPLETAAAETATITPKSSGPLLIWIIAAIVLTVLIIIVGVALIVLWRSGGSSTKGSSSKSLRPSRPAVKSSPRSKPAVRSVLSKQKSGGYRDRNRF